MSPVFKENHKRYIKKNYIEKNDSHRYWVAYPRNHSADQILYDSESNLIWQRSSYGATDSRDNVSSKIDQLRLCGIENWRLPSQDELVKLVESISSRSFLCSLNPGYYLYIHTETGSVYTDGNNDTRTDGEQNKAFGIAVTDILKEQKGDSPTLIDFIEFAFKMGWAIKPGGAEFQPAEYDSICGIHDLFADLDSYSSKLPELEEKHFTDPEKGIWEFHGTQIPEIFNVRERNPVLDIKSCNVTIDFGTSSTVVAIDENGRKKLLRIGVKDYWAKNKPNDYENPTVLEVIDLQSMLADWQKTAYRPMVSWDEVRCSHEALNNLRNNEANPKVVGSILSKIKHWALRETNGSQVRITDQENDFEHVLEPLTLRQTVKGQAIEASEDDPFDPLELYAWFLGLNINWRGRGIFLKYYMSFPVAYPKEVKEKILASFRRGLQRSLPHTLVDQPEFRNFIVEERASEPAAYAAAAMDELGIEPTEDGLAYAVFDFGGGTADFDYGYYRLPDDDEDDMGYEQVFEHVGAAGDQFLGGENLLENMAYRVFLDNLEVCRDNKVAFTRPLDADDFAGSEMFLEKTQAAATNTIMLMARLRPIWETGESENTTGVEVIELLNRDGEKVRCELSVNIDELLSYLEQRIEKGVQNFYVAMHKAFGNRNPEQVHVLLAGNSSRSTLVSDFFGLSSDEDEQALARYEASQEYLSRLFDGNAPEVVAYEPLAADQEDVYKPTAKTGVALGLLNLSPGSATKVINDTLEQSEDNAPFAFYVGRSQRKKFKPGLKQGTAYNEYTPLGPIRERVFHLYYTHSPKANTGDMPVGDNELYAKRLDFAGNTEGHKVFAKAISPSEIEICTAMSLESITAGEGENQQLIVLGGR